MLILAHCRKQEHWVSAWQAMISLQQLAFMHVAQGESIGFGEQPPPIGPPPCPELEDVAQLVLLLLELPPPCDELLPP